MAVDINMIKGYYENLPGKIAAIRKKVDKPLTLSEKILYAHLHEDSPLQEYRRGKDYVFFAPDRVAMQDATATLA